MILISLKMGPSHSMKGWTLLPGDKPGERDLWECLVWIERPHPFSTPDVKSSSAELSGENEVMFHIVNSQTSLWVWVSHCSISMSYTDNKCPWRQGENLALVRIICRALIRILQGILLPRSEKKKRVGGVISRDSYCSSDGRKEMQLSYTPPLPKLQRFFQLMQ